jgi:hypothetical protein
MTTPTVIRPTLSAHYTHPGGSTVEVQKVKNLGAAVALPQTASLGRLSFGDGRSSCLGTGQ